jgi:hypothetical protein
MGANKRITFISKGDKMNERIRELAEQATEYQEGETEGKHDIELFDKEKFAELIVRECVELMEEQHTWITNVSASKMIRMHFGVE